LPWNPDPNFDLALNRVIARSRDNAAIWARDRVARKMEALSARGMGQSGAALSAKEEIRVEELDHTVRGAIDGVLEMTHEVYGHVPAESVPWIRDKLNEWIDGMSAGFRRQAEEECGRAVVDPRAAVERIQQTAAALKRDLEIKLAPIELRTKLGQLTPPERPQRAEPGGADVFICHAGEDKETVALPLANRLKEMGYEVWIDKFSLKLGDRLLDKIDEGIASARFGVVILSARFFEKKWTRRELSGLAAREDAQDRPLILPVRVGLDQKELAKASPLLAAILGADWNEGLEAVIAKIVDVVGPPMNGKR
jgi:hypothetical protein